MQKVNFRNLNGQGITMAAVIHVPAGFDSNAKYPAVVVAHPGGGVKEQTAGLYAQKLAEHGLVAIAFDASYQGESSGEPRQLENPYIRTEDVSAVIDYLTTLPYVDADRIGAMGICAGGGYAANAAINDRRIKALGTVSAVNIGSMFRKRLGKHRQGCRCDSVPRARFAGAHRGRVGRAARHLAARADAQGRCAEQGTRRSMGVLPHAALRTSERTGLHDRAQPQPDHYVRRP
ncbi:alpha/beta hydrolase [Burkholderia multivorans]|uniref:alpha/beta hydrolase n=1 Tax=Burkholderia multivorans TaxID=87883 RepID=UPI0020A26F11|nr:alpha/beta hydrolase [Burkholderia multivorans]